MKRTQQEKDYLKILKRIQRVSRQAVAARMAAEEEHRKAAHASLEVVASAISLLKMAEQAIVKLHKANQKRDKLVRSWQLLTVEAEKLSTFRIEGSRLKATK